MITLKKLKLRSVYKEVDMLSWNVAVYGVRVRTDHVLSNYIRTETVHRVTGESGDARLCIWGSVANKIYNYWG